MIADAAVGADHCNGRKWALRLATGGQLQNVGLVVGAIFINGALPCCHVHMFVEIPPHVLVMPAVPAICGAGVY
jgi:hypothetical protein